MSVLPPIPPPSRIVPDLSASRHGERLWSGTIAFCVIAIAVVIITEQSIRIFFMAAVAAFGGIYLLGWAILSIKRRFGKVT